MSIINNFFLNFFLFNLGIIGIIINRLDLILILISIELILLGINMNLIIFAFYLNDLLGELFALIVLTVAASEAAIGLAIIISFFNLRGTININSINILTF